ncbi:hypothetical protein GQ457_07G006780 [Hibiscus cannabinus]
MEIFFIMLEDLGWSYLKEIFVEITHRSESLKHSERATWLEESGMPLHCWNQVTFKRLAELWETFEALGENAFRSIDCEKVTLLVTTSITTRINETVEIGVGSLVHIVSVVERGFTDAFSESKNLGCNGLNSVKIASQSIASQSESSSEYNWSQQQSTYGVGCNTCVVDDALNIIGIGKDHFVDHNQTGGEGNRSLGEL